MRTAKSASRLCRVASASALRCWACCSRAAAESTWPSMSRSRVAAWIRSAARRADSAWPTAKVLAALAPSASWAWRDFSAASKRCCACVLVSGGAAAERRTSNAAPVCFRI